jgi:hypothetical protein
VHNGEELFLILLGKVNPPGWRPIEEEETKDPSDLEPKLLLN